MYIDESYDPEFTDGHMTNLVIGGLMIRKSKKVSVNRILKQLKNHLNKDLHLEVKGGSIKLHHKIYLIEKLLILNKDCKVFYWYDDFIENKNNEVIKNEPDFNIKFASVVSNLVNNHMMKVDEHNKATINIYFDQRGGLQPESVKKRIIKDIKSQDKREYNVDKVQAVDSQKSNGVQVADIICNTFYQYHTKQDVRDGNSKRSWSYINKRIIKIIESN